MICILGKEDFEFNNTAVTIGKFDALHIGHKALIERMVQFKEKGLKTVVLRLDILSAGIPVRTEEERIEILEKLGVDIYIRYPFSETTGKMSAETFIKKILTGRLGARALVVGEDFRFGHGRLGDTQLLCDYGRKNGFETVTVGKVSLAGRTVSSSLIRDLLQHGEKETAAEMLGDNFTEV